MDAVLLRLVMIALAPVLLVQGRRVRRNALRLPEPTGARAGETGVGPRCLRLLLIGDSAIAGVGVASQHAALAGRLPAALRAQAGFDRTRLRWRVLAHSGLDAAGVLRLLDDEWQRDPDALAADVVVIGVGVNDVTGQTPLHRWLGTLSALDAVLRERHGARLVVLSGLPPMHRFPALPQPLRWYLGAWARRFDRALREWAVGRAGLLVPGFPEIDDPAAIAHDGFHPGASGYAAWAAHLSGPIAARWLAFE